MVRWIEAPLSESGPEWGWWNFLAVVVGFFFFQRLRGGIFYSKIEGWNFFFQRLRGGIFFGGGGIFFFQWKVEFFFQRLRSGIFYSEIDGWNFFFSEIEGWDFSLWWWNIFFSVEG